MKLAMTVRTRPSLPGRSLPLGVLLCAALAALALGAGAPAVRAVVAPAAGQIVEEIRVETLPAVTVLSLPMQGRYDQHEEALLRVLSLAQARDIARGEPFGLYHNRVTTLPADSLRWEICVPVPGDTRVDPPFVVRTLPETVAAVALCAGSYAQTHPCHEKLARWIDEHGYWVSGPTQEHWLSDLKSVPAEKLLARLVYPVTKKD